MSSQSSDDPEDFISIRDLTKIAKRAMTKSYNSPGNTAIRTSHLYCTNNTIHQVLLPYTCHT